MDVDTLGALQKSATHPVAFLYIQGLDEEGDPISVGLTTNPVSISVSVVSGTTGESELRNYEGEGVFLSWDTVQDTVGLQSRAINTKLSQISPTVNNMVRAYNVRNAVVELHVGYKSIATGLFVAPPLPEFVAVMDTIKHKDGAVGSDGETILRIVSDVADLSLTSSDMKSHASQKLRSGDMFRRYSGTAGRIVTAWGEARRQVVGF